MLVLIGVAATFRTAFLPHTTKPSVASKLAQTNHPVAAVPPQWLPVLLAANTPGPPTSQRRLLDNTFASKAELESAVGRDQARTSPLFAPALMCNVRFARCKVEEARRIGMDAVTANESVQRSIAPAVQSCGGTPELPTPAACEAARVAAHQRANVSTSTTCASTVDACVVGERLVLWGHGREAEARALALALNPKLHDYVWAGQKMSIATRGTISAVDQQPARFCPYNATLNSRKDICEPDKWPGVPPSSWINIDAQATANAVKTGRQAAKHSALLFFPVYPQNFAESFGNNAVSLYELYSAGWASQENELLPAASWWPGCTGGPESDGEILGGAPCDIWYQPFSAGPLTTLQRMGFASETRCFREVTLCHLGSLVFDQNYGAGVGNVPRRPWEAMQYIAENTAELQLRGEAKARAATWRTPALFLPRTGVANHAIQVRVVVRKGRRKLLNAHQLAGALNGWATHAGLMRGVPVNASTCSFAGEGFAANVRTARETDVLFGMHGADLVNGLFMHAGATVVEVRGFAWYDNGRGLWPGWFARVFALDAQILHYALQASLSDTVGAAEVQRRKPDSPISGHATWNMDVRVPVAMARKLLHTVAQVNGDAMAYRRVPHIVYSEDHNRLRNQTRGRRLRDLGSD